MRSEGDLGATPGASRGGVPDAASEPARLLPAAGHRGHRDAIHGGAARERRRGGPAARWSLDTECSFSWPLVACSARRWPPEARVRLRPRVRERWQGAAQGHTARPRGVEAMDPATLLDRVARSLGPGGNRGRRLAPRILSCHGVGGRAARAAQRYELGALPPSPWAIASARAAAGADLCASIPAVGSRARPGSARARRPWRSRATWRPSKTTPLMVASTRESG